MFLQLEFFLLVRFCRKYSFTTYIASCLVFIVSGKLDCSVLHYHAGLSSKSLTT